MLLQERHILVTADSKRSYCMVFSIWNHKEHIRGWISNIYPKHRYSSGNRLSSSLEALHMCNHFLLKLDNIWKNKHKSPRIQQIALDLVDSICFILTLCGLMWHFILHLWIIPTYTLFWYRCERTKFSRVDVKNLNWPQSVIHKSGSSQLGNR